MSTSLDEGRYQFHFPEGWWSGKWDGTPASKYQIFQGKTPACVDLVGIDGHGTVYLIEVKDHSEHLRENDKPLPDSLREKVHDTVMGVITAHRRGDTSGLCAPLLKALVKGAPVYVVLWLEEPNRQVTATRRQRLAHNGSVLMKKHAALFKWLNARFRVVNRHTCGTLMSGVSCTLREVAPVDQGGSRRRP
jgi:pyrimidine deaminase RibD-like protein